MTPVSLLQSIRKTPSLCWQLFALSVLGVVIYSSSTVSQAFAGAIPFGANAPAQTIAVVHIDNAWVSTTLKKGNHRSGTGVHSDTDEPHSVCVSDSNLLDKNPEPSRFSVTLSSQCEKQARYSLPSPRAPPTA